jgi:hypothetical protein
MDKYALRDMNDRYETVVSDLKEKLDNTVKALKVITETKHIENYLHLTDLKALMQARKAVTEALEALENRPWYLKEEVIGGASGGNK